jgi:hypothetical protein
MYHNPVGPMAATGLGAGSALFAFTPIGLIWALLATFAVAGAVGALLRIVPSMRAPRTRPVNRGAVPSRS